VSWYLTHRLDTHATTVLAFLNWTILVAYTSTSLTVCLTAAKRGQSKPWFLSAKEFDRTRVPSGERVDAVVAQDTEVAPTLMASRSPSPGIAVQPQTVPSCRIPVQDGARGRGAALAAPQSPFRINLHVFVTEIRGQR